jgi:hypothetical protein
MIVRYIASSTQFPPYVACRLEFHNGAFAAKPASQAHRCRGRRGQLVGSPGSRFRICAQERACRRRSPDIPRVLQPRLLGFEWARSWGSRVGIARPAISKGKANGRCSTTAAHATAARARTTLDLAYTSLYL